MKSKLLLLLIVATSALLASCSEPKAYHYKAYGKVVDTAGQPITGVRVVLSGFDLERVRSVEALTGEDGSFLLNFDINPFEWRQEAHWVFHLSRDGYLARFVNYPEFAYDDRFRYQGYWYEVYFRGPVAMKSAPVDESAITPDAAKPVPPGQ